MSEERSACPGPARLRDFHAGRLTGQEAHRVAEHTQDCAACFTELTELSLDDRYAADLREILPDGPGDSSSAPPPERGPDAEYEALVTLLRESTEGERYEVLGELGHGGMGVVYEVRDRVLQRKLAMKVARADRQGASSAASPTGRRLARFLEEVRITGQLDHPSIIPVHELGVDAQGHVFFTMRKVRGQNLREVFEEYERGAGDWTLRRLVALVLRACDALAYAHSKQVVHRDLKPSNIMVERFGAVYVMDWGVAKVLSEGGDGGGPRDAAAGGSAYESQLLPRHEAPDSEDESASPLLTLDGEVLGTPAYMAPEQALGQAHQVDLRADVYSMGAVYYRLLSGHRPYDGGAERVTPHASWSRLIDGPPAPLGEVAPEAPPELVAVCERAMARDPAERYTDMAGLAADLRAWLEGRVVRAHKTGVVVEMRKWVGRNRALASAALLVVLALAVVPGLLVKHSAVEARSRDDVARRVTALAAHRLLDEEPVEALRLAIQVAEAEPTYLSRTMVLAALQPLARDTSFHNGWSKRGTTWWMEGSRRAWSPAGDSFVFAGSPRQDEPVTIRVWNVKARRFDDRSFYGSKTEVCIFHPDGRRIASGGTDGSLAIHDLETGRSQSLQNEDGRAHAQVVSRLAFDPDGELLASASWDGSIRLWNAATGELERNLEGHTGVVSSIEFDASGERLLSASGPPSRPFESDGTARVWNVADGVCLFVFGGHEKAVTSARFHPADDLVLSTSYDHTAQLWEPQSGEIRARMSFRGAAWDGAFSRDGSTLAVAFESGFLVRDVESGREERFDEYEAHDGRSVNDVEFSPDGDRLLTIGFDRVGRVWDLEAGRRPQLALRLRGLSSLTFGSWSPDGSTIATVGTTTGLWFPDGNPATDQVRPTQSVATHARFHPLGDRVLLTFEDCPAYEYAFAPGAGLQSPPSTLGDAPARDVATSAGGTWTLVAQANGRLGLWRRGLDGASREAGFLELDAESLHPALACEVVGVILANGGAAVVDCSGEPEVTARFAEGETVTTIRFSEDGRRTALGTAGGRVLVVDLAANGSVLMDEQLDPKSPSQIAVFDVSFFDSGRRLVSAGPQKGVKVWNVDAGREVEHVGGDESSGAGWWATVGGVFVIREGLQLLARDQWGNFSVSLAEMANGSVATQRVLLGRGLHRNRISAWALDEPQRRMLTTSLDRTAIVWDLERAEPWVTFAGHDVPVLAGDLSPDGEWAVTADASGRVFVWPTDPLDWAIQALPVETEPKRR